MDNFTRADLDFLAAQHDGPCISLFLPTHRKGEIDQDPIRLANLLREAEDRLERDGRRRVDLEPIFTPIRRLIDDPDFWQHQEDGLAVFAAPDLFRSYRVPLAMREFAGAAKRFHIKPLIPVLNRTARFYVLELSQKRVAFYEGDRDRLDPISLEGVPTRVEDVAGYSKEQQGLQLSTRTPRFEGGAQARAGTRGQAIFHGQGRGGDEAWRKSELHHFLERMDAALWTKIKDLRPPLIPVGVDYVLAEFRAVTKYPNVHNVGIDSEPDSLSKEELHREAWQLVSAIFAAERTQNSERFHNLAGTGKASSQLEIVIGAAHDGRIDRLFVAADREQWGTFDPITRKLSREESPRVDNYDLLDDAARQTLGHAGEVFVVPQAEIPDGSTIAAIFRW